MQAALAIIDEKGWEGLNMRMLGRRLKVNAASLYYHFRDKDEILDAVVEHMTQVPEVARPMPAQSWEEAAINLASNFRSVIAAHPNAAVLVAIRRARFRPAAVHPHYEFVLKKLIDGGFSNAQAMLALAMLETIAFGTALEEANMGPITLYEPVDAEQNPTLHQVVSNVQLDIRKSFPDMCRAVLHGILSIGDGQNEEQPGGRLVKSGNPPRRSRGAMNLPAGRSGRRSST